MKKTYILLKDSPELRKGALLIEECDDGDQDFVCEDLRFIKHPDEDNSVLYVRDVVMTEPLWFKKVDLVEMQIPKAYVMKVKKLIRELESTKVEHENK